MAAAQAQFLKATSGALTVPVESLPTAAKPYVRTVYYLEQKIQPKDEVLAEVMAEHVALRKGIVQNSGRLVRQQAG